MQNRGDILQRATGVQICRTADKQMLARRQNAAVVIARRMQGALGFVIQRDLAFATGRRLPTTALRLDQRAHRMLAIADYFRRLANRRGHHFKANHQNPQIKPFVEAFEQHAAVKLLCRFDGLLHLFDALQIHRYALALFTVERFDHHPLMLIEEGQIVVGITGQLLRGQVQSGAFEHFVGQAFVLAQAHADRAGQVAQRFAATHATPAVAESEQPGIGVIHLHVDAASMSFFNDDPRIRIELRFWPRAEKQRLVDAVFALDGEGRQIAKAELGVEVFRLPVVMQN
ncbi:hypothetical protein D3C85_193080 [compost metagenome]